MPNTINFAIIGAGFIGKRHAAIIERNPETKLLAFCDIRSREVLALEAFNQPLYTDAEAMLEAHPEVDVVCICSPNGLHAEHALVALKAHKHIVCEKPMGLTKAECEAIIFQSLNVSRHVFCVMQNRYSPPSVWLKELMLGGQLGKIHMVQINCYWNRDERYYLPNGKPHVWKGIQALDGGTLFTQFSHFVDIMYWLFGDIQNIQARFADFKHREMTDFEDSGLINFEFVNGGLGCINYSTAVAQSNLESSLTIIGENGSVKVGGQYMNEVEVCNIKDYEMPVLKASNPANDYGHYKGSAANHVYVIQNVVDVLKGRKQITTNALEGLKVVEIIEKIYQYKNK